MKPITVAGYLRLWLPVILTVANTVAQNQTNSSPELAVQVDDTAFEIRAVDGGSGGMSRVKLLKSGSSSEKSPVVELHIRTNREGEVVVIHLSVKLANEKEVVVGTYRLRYNESTTAQELSNLGVEPISLRIVKAKPAFVDPSPPIQPLIENRTKAVELVNFYREPSIPNSFRLTLRNLSTKSIIAVDLWIPSDSGGQGQRATGDPEHPVMKPGDTSEHMISISRGGRRTPSGYVPDPVIQQTLIVRTTVAQSSNGRGFSNYSIRPLWPTDRKPQPTIDEFKELIYALTDAVDNAQVEELIARFPTVAEASVVNAVKSGLNQGKRQLLFYIGNYEADLKQGGSTLTFPQWLTGLREEYKRTF